MNDLLPDLASLADIYDHVRDNLAPRYRLGVVVGSGGTPGTYLVSGIGEVDSSGNPVSDGHTYYSFLAPQTPSAGKVISAPSIGKLAALGSGGGTSIATGVSNDQQGAVNVKFGSGAIPGAIATVTFSSPWSAIPVVVFGPTNPAASAYQLGATLVTASGFQLTWGKSSNPSWPNPPPNGTLVTGNYIVSVPAVNLNYPLKAVVLVGNHEGQPFIMGQLHN